MMNPLIIKLGGVLLDSEEALERLFSALVNYRESHQRPLVIVHGGGCVVDELMKGLNLPVKKKNGLRVTPADQIDIITGAQIARPAQSHQAKWCRVHIHLLRCVAPASQPEHTKGFSVQLTVVRLKALLIFLFLFIPP